MKIYKRIFEHDPKKMRALAGNQYSSSKSKQLTRITETVGERETFSFLGANYNVNKAWIFIQKKKHEIASLNINDISKYFGVVKIDKKYAMSLSIEEAEQPGIFVVDDKYDFQMLIDGWHRAYNLYINKIKKMDVYLIDNVKEVESIRL